MAFGKGKETKEVVVRRFIGVAPVKVLGVNLSKEELSNFYGREITKDRDYLSTVDVNGVETKRVTLSFLLSCEIEGMEFMTTANFNLTDTRVVGTTSGKTQVIDIYGRTAWATPEELANHQIPMYASGPANISEDYRPLYRGEEQLTLFLQRLLAIPNVTKFVDSKPVGMIDNPEDAESRLEHIDSYFNGDFSEIKEILSYQPENKVKMLFGVRTDDKNNVWQDVFVDFALLANSRNYSKMSDALKSAKDSGRYPNSIFEVCELKEYVESPTSFGAAPTATPPAGNAWFNKSN